jgi:chromatin remodeling complex protein RSC6
MNKNFLTSIIVEEGKDRQPVFPANKEYFMNKKTTVKKKTTTSAPKKKATKSAPKKKAGLTQITYGVSEELQAVVGAKQLTRPQIVKKMWEYIKAKKCQDVKNKRMINPDEKLSKVIGNKPVDMLKLATHLNKHIKK